MTITISHPTQTRNRGIRNTIVAALSALILTTVTYGVVQLVTDDGGPALPSTSVSPTPTGVDTQTTNPANIVDWLAAASTTSGRLTQ